MLTSGKFNVKCYEILSKFDCSTPHLVQNYFPKIIKINKLVILLINLPRPLAQELRKLVQNIRKISKFFRNAVYIGELVRIC